MLVNVFLASQGISLSELSQSESVTNLLISASLEHLNDLSDNDYADYADYNNYNDYRDSDLDLDWVFFLISDLATQLTTTDKLRNLNRDIEG